MATEAKAEKKDRSVRSAVRSEEARKFRAGDRVKYEGKLAKVISYGVAQINAPGQDSEFSDGPVLGLQLPAASVGAKPNYAYNVSPDEVEPVKDEEKAKLEKEFGPLFGDPVAAEPEEEKRAAPKIRQSGPAPEAKRTSSTRGVKAEAAPAKREARDTTGGAKIDTSKPAAAPKKAAKAAKKK